ncbi:MAG: restriction endonuclease subunit S [Vicinamibacterales bacterium]
MTTLTTVALGEVLRQRDDTVGVIRDEAYPIAGIYGFGRGLFAREPILGSQTSYTALNRLHAGTFVISRVKAWEGAVGVVPPELDGYFVSKEFPSFVADAGRLDLRWLKYFFDSEHGRRALAGCTKGIGARRERVKEAVFLDIALSLPPLSEQQAIVARLDALTAKTEQVEVHLDAAERDAEHLLALRFRDVIADAPMHPLGDVAPAVRRPVALDVTASYREVGARSFGKGLFAKPNFEGSAATWEKPVWIKAGDLVFSNIKAWEGAIGVVGEEHDGCIASHRYITCVPDPTQMTVGFLAYYLLSEDGLEKVGAASPGTADRNRTLSLGNLGKIEVPTPPLSIQRSFNQLQTEVAALRAEHAAIRAANAAIIPATLERIFRG